MIDAGKMEVTYSQQEKIGLPNWSFLTIMVSAKTTVDPPKSVDTYTFLAYLANLFMREVVEQKTKSINIWHIEQTYVVPDSEIPGLVPQGIYDGPVEIVISVTETVGLPEKASINILASSKMLADAGTEFELMRKLYMLVEGQLRAKRDVVLSNPRPWTQS